MLENFLPQFSFNLPPRATLLSRRTKWENGPRVPLSVFLRGLLTYVSSLLGRVSWKELGMVMHVFNPSYQSDGNKDSSSRPAWAKS
jgi:hypothetical protein